MLECPHCHELNLPSQADELECSDCNAPVLASEWATPTPVEAHPHVYQSSNGTYGASFEADLSHLGMGAVYVLVASESLEAVVDHLQRLNERQPSPESSKAETSPASQELQ